MNDWRHGEMPRAFLVKNKLRRSNAVADSSRADINCRDLGDFDSDERPTQLQNSESRCLVAEHDHEKNRCSVKLTHRTQSDERHAAQSQGS